jgi:hypothetical protein
MLPCQLSCIASEGELSTTKDVTVAAGSQARKQPVAGAAGSVSDMAAPFCFIASMADTAVIHRCAQAIILGYLQYMVPHTGALAVAAMPGWRELDVAPKLCDLPAE